MRVAFDTNFLVYAEDMLDERRFLRALQFMKATANGERCIPVQVLGEFHRVLRRKIRLSAGEAVRLVRKWSADSTLLPTDDETFELALELCSRHQFDIWDAIILSAAAQARCDILLSEDRHSGFIWRGVTGIDPFAGELHPLAVHLLRTG